MEERFISAEQLACDESENKLRPNTLSEYVGQEKIKDALSIFMTAAKQRGECIDHILLYGPPGLGKTTLATIVANEMNSNIRLASGPTIESAADLAAILTNLQKGDILFIDEVHRLNRHCEEILYTAMEDYALDMVIGKGPSARTMRLNLQPFTLIGATTRAGKLSSPLRDRFGIINRLEMYNEKELEKIIIRSSNILGIKIEKEALVQMAMRSRGTPRIANRLLKRVRDFAQVLSKDKVDIVTAKKTFGVLQIDSLGLDWADINILATIIDKFNGGPVGIETLAAASGEDAVTIEDIVEPYLLQLGYIAKTPRGRIATEGAYKHLGKKVPFCASDDKGIPYCESSEDSSN